MIFKGKIEIPSLRTEVLKKEKFNVLDCIYRFYFRKFLIVKLEVGKELYFRFYDHRVLRIFLPTCYEKQLKYFFGLIKVFAMESEDAEFELKNGLWISKKISKQDFWNRLNVGVCSITVVFNTIKLQKSYENGDMLK